MEWFVLAVWIVQAAAGTVMFARWVRSGTPRGPRPLAHGVIALGGLALWIAFLTTDAIVWAWTAFVFVTAGNVLGDMMLTARSRRRRGVTADARSADYGTAIADVFAGRLPRLVTFHALFAGVVYFSCLGVCIGATVAAAA